MRPLQRITPRLGPEHYQTYAIRRPTSTHSRRASCAEVSCSAYRLGWVTLVDEATHLGQLQAQWIRGGSGRRFTEQPRPDGLTEFAFPAEQPCFAAAEHRVDLDRPSLYLVAGGDYRGNPRGIRVRRHTSARDWVDDFGEHQLRLADRVNRG